MKSKRSKATNISMKVKKIVFERDKGRCVVCGCDYNVMPNAHILSRNHGGLGVETNVVTLCTGFTQNNCHYKYDNGTKAEHDAIYNKIVKYMKSIYKDWSIDNQKYSKY